MDPDLCREHVAKLLTDENGCLSQLAELLEREHQILKTHDIVALQGAIKQRQACVGRIVRIEDERRSLCRMLGHSADVKGLRGVAALVRSDRHAERRLGTLHRPAPRRCREFNDRKRRRSGARPPDACTGSPRRAHGRGRRSSRLTGAVRPLPWRALGGY